ncbi:MAG: response regulator [bacterium]
MMGSILIVDDDQATRDSLNEAMSINGYETLTIADGYIAVTIVKRDLIDIVILDVNMPGQGGLQTLRGIKVVRPQLPVIMTSGTPTESVITAAIEEGASSFMRKPIDINYLRRTVREILEIGRGEKLEDRAQRPKKSRLLGSVF